MPFIQLDRFDLKLNKLVAKMREWKIPTNLPDDVELKVYSSSSLAISANVFLNENLAGRILIRKGTNYENGVRVFYEIAGLVIFGMQEVTFKQLEVDTIELAVERIRDTWHNFYAEVKKRVIKKDVMTDMYAVEVDYA